MRVEKIERAERDRGLHIREDSRKREKGKMYKICTPVTHYLVMLIVMMDLLQTLTNCQRYSIHLAFLGSWNHSF